MSTKTEKAEKGEKPEKPDVKVALATFNERLMAALVDYGIIIAIWVVGIILQVAISYVPLIGGWLSWLLGMAFYIAGFVAIIYIFIWMPFKKRWSNYRQENAKY